MDAFPSSDVDAFLDDLLERTTPPPATSVNFEGMPGYLNDFFSPSLDFVPDLVPVVQDDLELDRMTEMMDSYFDLGSLNQQEYGLEPEDEDDLVEALSFNQKYQDELRSILADLEHAEASISSYASRLRQAQKRLWSAQKAKLVRPALGRSKGSRLRQEMSLTGALGMISADQLRSLFFPKVASKEDEGKGIRKAYMQIVGSCRRWSSRESQALVEVIRQSQQKGLVNAAVDESNGDAGVLKEKLGRIQRMTPEQLDHCPVDAVDWTWVATQMEGRSAADCRIHWTLHQHPLINKGEWGEEEIARLGEIVGRIGASGKWSEVAEELGTNRTAHACLAMYQRRLRADFLKGRWTVEEDAKLLELIRQYGESNWPMIASLMDGRTGAQCMLRFQKTLDPSIRKGKWTEEEDELLRFAVKFHGSSVDGSKKDWFLICRWVPGRTDVQCRERWMNILSPELKAEPFTPEEDRLLCDILGDDDGSGAEVSWAAIQAKHFPGRTDSQVRRRWKQLSRAKKKQSASPLIRKKTVRKPKTEVTTTPLEGTKRKRGRPRKTEVAEREQIAAAIAVASPRRKSTRKARPSKFMIIDSEDDPDI